MGKLNVSVSEVVFAECPKSYAQPREMGIARVGWGRGNECAGRQTRREIHVWSASVLHDRARTRMISRPARTVAR